MYTIKTAIPRPDGDVAIEFKFPTDEQWKRRSMARKTRIVNLGRGKTKEEPLGGDIDAEILGECLVLADGAEKPAITNAEALQVLNQIAEISIVDFDRRSSGYEVRFDDCLENTHETRIKVPTRDQLEAYRKDLVRIRQVDSNTSVMSVNLEAVEEMWNTLAGEPLPVVWKAAVLGKISEAVSTLAMARSNP